MTNSIKDFTKNFQQLDEKQLKNIIGGNGDVSIMAYNRKRRVQK